MMHDSTWLARTRATRWMRLAAPVGFLLTCVLLAGFAQIASAATYDMRGEWSIELKSAKEPPFLKAGVINQMNLVGGEFSGTLHEKSTTSSIEGTLSGTTASITITSHTSFGVITFVTKTAAVNTTTNSLSGSGAYYLEGQEIEPSEISGTRTKTYLEVQKREAQELKEQEEKEAKEREAREAKERQEKEARETKARQEKEAKEKEARELKERELKEQEEKAAKEKQEREAASKNTSSQTVGGNTGTTPSGEQGGATLVSTALITRTLATGRGGTISLDLSNPNGFPVQGHLTLVMAGTGKAAKGSAAGRKKGKTKALSLGTASFAISAHANETVKISLSRRGRAELARHKTLRVLLTIVTDASGKPNVSKAYTLTLHAAAPAHRRH
jgi:hypothetical protein